MRLLFLLFLFICVNANAQKDIISDYKHTINYEDHQVLFQLQETGAERKSVNPNKKYYWYSSNQIKITQGGYSGRLLDGSYEDYYPNKSLKEKGRFEMGLKVGEWNSWDDDGILRMKVNFVDGTLSGEFFKYDTLGVLIEQGKYKHGFLHGKLKRTTAKDNNEVLTYVNGIQKPAKARQPWFKKMFFWRKKTAG